HARLELPPRLSAGRARRHHELPGVQHRRHHVPGRLGRPLAGGEAAPRPHRSGHPAGPPLPRGRLGLAGGRGGGALGDPPQHGRHGPGLGGTDGGGVRGCPVRPLVRGWRDGPPRRPRRPPPVVRTDEAPPPRGLTRPRVPARPSVRRGPGLLVSRGGTVDPAPELEEPVTAVVEDLDWVEHAARMFEPDPPPPPPKWATPGEMALALDPRTVQTGALDLIDDALKWALETPDSRLIISMPPQEGKSQRASRRFPLWCLTQNPELRVAIISYEA